MKICHQLWSDDDGPYEGHHYDATRVGPDPAAWVAQLTEEVVPQLRDL